MSELTRPEEALPVRSFFLLFMLLLASVAFARVPEDAPKPLGKDQIVELLRGGVPSRRVIILVKQRGIDFEPIEGYLLTLQEAGANESLLNALRLAKRVLPKDRQLAEHRRRAEEFEKRQAYADGEREYRSALRLAPEDAALHSALGRVLTEQNKWDGAVVAYREAILYEPDDPEAHCDLAVALNANGDVEGAVAVFRQAARLKPDHPRPHEEAGRMYLERRA